jgi:hypothetical protein
MTPDLTHAVPKVHPATRDVEPDDPMNLHGVQVDGDPEVMLHILVEEYARMGYGLEALMVLSRDPFYVGFHGLLQLYGEEELERKVSRVLSRCGVFRVVTREAAPPPENLVELDLAPHAGPHGKAVQENQP